MNKEKILITGASGFIGGNLLSGLKELGIDAYGTYKSNKRETSLEYLDLNNPESISECISKIKPTIMIHSAALADASKCETDKKAAFNSNVEGTKCLLDSLMQLELQAKFVLISTDLVFNGEVAGKEGYTENQAPDPLSIYGESKAAAEKIFLSSGVQGFIARISLAYGPPIGESMGFLGWMIKSLKSHQPLILFEDEWRTPVYTGDLVKFFADWITRETDLSSINQSIVHLGGKDRLSRYDIGLLLSDILDVPRDLLNKKLRSEFSSENKRPRDVSLSSKLAADLCGYRPQSFYSCVQGLLKSASIREFTDFNQSKVLP